MDTYASKYCVDTSTKVAPPASVGLNWTWPNIFTSLISKMIGGTFGVSLRRNSWNERCQNYRCKSQHFLHIGTFRSLEPSQIAYDSLPGFWIRNNQSHRRRTDAGPLPDCPRRTFFSNSPTTQSPGAYSRIHCNVKMRMSGVAVARALRYSLVIVFCCERHNDRSRFQWDGWFVDATAQRSRQSLCQNIKWWIFVR